MLKTDEIKCSSDYNEYLLLDATSPIKGICSIVMISTPKKKVLMDASSAIILAKAGLSSKACAVYHVIMPPSVFSEVADNDKPGAAEYREFASQGKIEICDLRSGDKGQPLISDEKPSFGAGEADLLKLYWAGAGDFLIVYDGAAARYCLREKIPFINALLFPRVLEADRVNPAESQRLQQEILKHGHYAEDVIEFTHCCPAKELAFFLP